jgi:hypothetical protein
MKRRVVVIVLFIAMLIVMQDPSTAMTDERPQDSRDLMFQDMLMLFLLPHIDKKIDDIYSNILTESPQVYPYFVNVEKVQRVNGFRGFHFSITLDVIPTVGPHIPVGEDQLTFDISPVNPDNVKLVSWKHVKGPQKSDFPPNWADILK